MSEIDGLTRLEVNMNKETTEALREYASSHGVNITEAVRRAISVLSFIDGAAAAGGQKLLIQSADGRELWEVVLR